MSGYGTAFWRLLISSGVSNVADGIGRTVLPLLATTLTRDPLAISALTTLAFLPWLLCALPVGALVDRHDRKTALVTATLFRGAAFGVLAVGSAVGWTHIAVLYVAVFAVGVAETVYDSAGRAMLPMVVRRDQLERGNSMLSTAEIGGQSYVGAPVGAVLFGVFVAAPLFANALAFALAAALMVTVGGAFRPPGERRAAIGSDIRAGVRWLASHRFLRGLTLANAVTSAAQSMANAVLVLFALDVLRVPEGGYGFILAVVGVGGLAGGLLAPVLSARLGRAGTLALVSLTFPLALAGMGLTGNAFLATALYGLAALLVMTGNVLTMALRQTLIPEQLFGRVQGAYRTLVWGGIPLGALAGGALAATAGIPVVFVVSGLVSLVAGAWTCHLLARHHREINVA
ncbi:MFS transporter [Sphaerisporangium rubeum]|uniref:MFS family permease n=1 Tax=Sphaerisporangium rubeum TaxID=321317 RepID=A0A7X0M9B6_9ACTN|nr:MFS transporter [Sphaerisporangium rubeum]MBB6476733.1 MFS family permease [Sphaerisporangium rubeum]